MKMQPREIQAICNHSNAVCESSQMGAITGGKRNTKVKLIDQFWIIWQCGICGEILAMFIQNGQGQIVRHLP